MKRNRILSIIFLIFFTLPLMLSAQGYDSIFAPFVSSLRAHVTGQRVELTWLDSSSVRGEVLIFRSRTPFSNWGEQPGGEQTAKVFYGRQNYTDEVQTTGRFYYLVVSTGAGGEKYEMIIPLHNMVEVVVDGGEHITLASGIPPQRSSGDYTGITQPEYEQEEQVFPLPDKTAAANALVPTYQPYGVPLITQPAAPAPLPAVVAAAPPAMPDLTGLGAYPDGKGIKLNFISGNPAKNVVLYRNKQPITKLNDLLSSEIVHLPGAQSPFVDSSAQPGISYYYALVYDEDIRTGAASILPPYNATVQPVSLNAPPGIVLPPLPQTVSSPGSSTATVRPQGKLSPEASAALTDTSFTGARSFQSPAPPARNAAEPQIFKVDLQVSPEGSKDRSLQNIVQGPFVWRNWNQAKEALRKLLASAKNPEIEGRARFYLGQAHYFSEDADKALTEFLAVQSRFPDETAFWIRSSLEKLSNNGR
jgi:hypothetical protein